MSASLLEVRKISKSFPGVRALHEVSFTLGKGEIIALLGENGAGKSTLMKILAGVQEADSGDILLDEKPVSISSVQDGLNHGIALIHQELNLSTNLSVAANIFLGREPKRFGLIDEKKILEESSSYLKKVGLDVDPSMLVGDLPIGKQQLVEIAKALSIDSRILIMDEPTSSLSQKEAERLFAVAKDLRSMGVSIIYISHRLGEVIELADRVVVLRDGENAGELEKEKINHDQMVSLMVGRELSQFYAHTPEEPGETVLRLDGVTSAAHPEHPLSLELKSGEIVGLAGLVGAGRTDFLHTLFGIAPDTQGNIEVKGKRVTIQSPRDAIHAGLALVPENRKEQGLIIEMAVNENLSLASLEQKQRRGFRNRASENGISKEMIERMRIKTPSENQVVRYLSGGNQQKVVLGKWLALQPDILLLDEPTRGIDVGAKQEIYGLMEELSAQGVAILFVSSEMEEILGMSDRALVMHEGRITGEIPRQALSEEAVMKLATNT